AAQGQLGAERAFIETLESLAKEYRLGVTLDILKRDYGSLRRTAGEFTPDTTTAAAFAAAEGVVNDLNAWLAEEEKHIGARLSSAASSLTNALTPVAERHLKWDARISAKLD